MCAKIALDVTCHICYNAVAESKLIRQLQEQSMKPFAVANQWIDYAHGPGAEDGQPMATELVDMVTSNDGSTLIPANRADLVAELVSVAELYDGGTSVQDDDRLWFRGYPKKIIRRGRAWLAHANASAA